MAFNPVGDRTQAVLRGIIEDAAAGGPARSPLQQKIGDAYASCMDASAIEAHGIEPLKPELDRIGALRNKADLPALVGFLQSRGAAGLLFGFGATRDAKNAARMIAVANQAGLGMPDRDYYLKDDPKSADLRKADLSHLARVFEMLGATADQAGTDARAVLTIETALATHSLSRVERRDPNKLYNKMSFGDWQALAPAFSFEQYLAAVGSPAVREIVVPAPAFFKGLSALVDATGIPAWQAYLRWHMTRAATRALPARFVDADFAFFGKTLQGTPEMQPRWRRCVGAVNVELSDAVGRLYVERAFGAEAKARAVAMVRVLEATLAGELRSLPWMTDATRTRAVEKLRKIAVRIGYPDRWIDYSTLRIERGDALGNLRRAAAFAAARNLSKIGKPVDRDEWGIPAPTVDAFASGTLNAITFPAGILQPPFFATQVDDALNYGAIGAVIGHEIIHLFDDTGRKFDGDGNLNDWWTAEDAKQFEERTACVVDQYAATSASTTCG